MALCNQPCILFQAAVEVPPPAELEITELDAGLKRLLARELRYVPAAAQALHDPEEDSDVDPDPRELSILLAHESGRVERFTVAALLAFFKVATHAVDDAALPSPLPNTLENTPGAAAIAAAIVLL